MDFVRNHKDIARKDIAVRRDIVARRDTGHWGTARSGTVHWDTVRSDTAHWDIDFPVDCNSWGYSWDNSGLLCSPLVDNHCYYYYHHRS